MNSRNRHCMNFPLMTCAPFRGAFARAAAVAVICLVAAIPASVEASQTEKLQFNKDVRSILAANCFPCHGPDSAARKADLRLDRRDVAIRAGAIAPGDPKKSGLIERIFEKNPDTAMPPVSSHKQLTGAEKEVLRRWINEGAEYQPHWSFLGSARPVVPAAMDSSWARNPIDAFVAAKLAELGLSPASEADRATLARRLSLDLTGLLPSPDIVDGFVVDASPGAYEKLVDNLLSSTHWGEHRARYWLDIARYGDTHGIHYDNYREMWTYRDWVINAFNRNQPFDQFTIEQLAGDLIPNSSLEQRIATGFNRCNITTNEGGAIDEEYRALYTRDRTETTAAAWLGLTAGCAVCHDHKFDPLSQREFYELAAFFNNTTQSGLDGNVKDTPPIQIVPTAADRYRWEQITPTISDLQIQINGLESTAAKQLDLWLNDISLIEVRNQDILSDFHIWVPLSEDGNTFECLIDGKPQAVTSQGESHTPGWTAKFAYQASHSARLDIAADASVERDSPFSCGAWIKLTNATGDGAVCACMDDENSGRGWDICVRDGSLCTHLAHSLPDDAIEIRAKNALSRNEWHHVFMTYDGTSKASGIKLYIDEKLQPVENVKDSLTGSTKSTAKFSIGRRSAQFALHQASVQDVRMYRRDISVDEIARLAKVPRISHLAEKPRDELATGERDELAAWYLNQSSDTFRQLGQQLHALETELGFIRARSPVAHVMQEGIGPASAFILERGDYSKRHDEVSANTPAFLPSMPANYPKNRLGFAKWLVHPANPLTARVAVNHFWQELFGTGIVKTAGDFGVSGELPSNQDLLDWLAVEFRESNWDVKHIYKLMVMSSTYRQSAVATEDKLRKDPENRYLSRGPRFRMDAEMIRDCALIASGLMVDQLGGASVKPYQPYGVWEAVAIPDSNTRSYFQDSGHALYRRSLYTFWKRAAPPASMEIFNAPSREVCTVRRERTNTPLQALVTLNDPQFTEASRHLAEIACNLTQSIDDRLQFVSKRILCRSLRADELTVLKRDFEEHRAYYAQHVADAKELIAVGDSRPSAQLLADELAAWTVLANDVLNFDEALNK